MPIKYLILAIAGAALAGGAGAFIAIELTHDDALGQVSQSVAAIEQRLNDLEAERDWAAESVVTETQAIESRLENQVAAVQPNGQRRETAGRGSRFDFAALSERLDESQRPEDRLAAARELMSSPMPPARMMAMRTLIELQDEQALDAVRDLVGQADGNRMTQRMAEQAIEMLTDANMPGVDTELYQLLDHDNAGLQLAAARTLEGRGDSNPMHKIVDSLAFQLDSDDGGARSRAASQLGRTRSPAAVEPLTAALSDGNSEVRLRAAQALGSTGQEAAIEQLTASLNDPVAEVRSVAARSIDRIRNPDAGRGGPDGFFGRGFPR